MPKGKLKVSDLTIKQICDHYSITKSYKVTAKMFGLSDTTIRYIVNKIGPYKQP
ncbi:hypothetical protein LCGC14_1619930 [marine sediment metagenome]|uniref:Transposase Synechocystis PCC 6803 domain-containing protein n=1 Tax=marine sediment metagenome TaxID=412755 RepID=A0A0F9KLC4_9ZZZZ